MKKLATFVGLLICAYIVYNAYTSLKTNKHKSDFCVETTSKVQVEQPKIPKIFIINLDRTPERFEFVKKQLDQYKLKYTRFSAIDGYKIELKNVKTGKFLTPDQKKDFYHFSWNQKPCKYDVLLNNKHLIQLVIKRARFSLGEIGVFCSHREIWKTIIKNGYDQAIIFEDDVILEKNFKQNLQKFLTDLPEDWDIAFLGIGRRNNKYGYFVSVGEIFRDLDNVEGHPLVAKIQPSNLTYGMYGYAINQKGAKKLLELTDFSDMPIDDIVFQNGGINTGKIKGYVSMKKLIEPKQNDSEIKRMGRSY